MSWDDTSHAVFYQEEEDVEEIFMGNLMNEEDVMNTLVMKKEDNMKKEDIIKKEDVMKKEDGMKEELMKEDSTDEENDEGMSIALRVKCRKMSKLSPISFNCQNSDCESVSVKNDSCEDSYVSVTPDETFIDSIISLVRRIAPDLRYSKVKSDARRKRQMRKERRKVTKSIHPDLRCLWRHMDQLLAPPAPRVEEVSPYPRVDWTKVNTRNLANLPKPQRYAVHGCEPDPNFYEKKSVNYGSGTNYLRSDYEGAMPYPYGSLPGFRTQAGIIAPYSHGEVVSGYTWSPDDEAWVLHARIKGKAPNAGSRKVNKEDKKKKKW